MAKKNKKNKKQVPPSKGKKKVVKTTEAIKQEKPQQKKRSPKVIAFGVLGLLVILFFLSQTAWFKNLNLFSGSGSNTSAAVRQAFPQFSGNINKEEIEFNDFVGSETCQSCHAKEYDLWKKSTHGQAGGSPSPDFIIGEFDGRGRPFADAIVTPQRVGNQFQFRFEPEDLPAQTFKVDAVVGKGHMIGGGTQTYFSRFPDGTVRFLPFDYIRDEKVWFGETDKGKGWIPITEDLPINDLSEWPPSRILGAHLSLDNCQECHGSQIQVKFDPEQKKFDTKYKTLAINCESCHGPGKKHVELALSGNIDTAQDIGMLALATLSKDESLEVCFRCHALKDALDPGYLQGKDIENHYGMKLPILGENPYHPDGRIRAFGYQQNHLFSDCYVNGSMTCVDCHDPHSQGYRDITGKALASPFDDGQCTGCHGSKINELELHTHHKIGSPGSQCVSCHMPYLQHQAMGDELRFARSDHTIPIPRPSFDEEIGIQNACSQCHQDKSVEWLQAKTVEWYGELKPHKEIVANLSKTDADMDRKSAGTLLLNGSTVHYVGHMASLSKFVKNYISPDMASLEPEIVDGIKKFVESPDLDIKSLALASLHLAQDNNPAIHNYLAQQLENLKPEDQAKVRKRWVMIMPYLVKKYEDKGEFQKAIIAYKRALEVLPNNFTTITHLGYCYQQMGNSSEAIRYYKKATQIAPNDDMSWVNLGNAQQNANDVKGAITAYLKAEEINPWNAITHFNLGNYHYRLEDMPNAIQRYTKAIEIDPSLSQAYFNLCRSYIKNKQFREALTIVKAGLRFDPINETGLQMRQDLEEAFERVR